MKRCPWCGKLYTEEAVVCAIDQHFLEIYDPPADINASCALVAAQNSTYFLQVIVPIFLWFVATIVVVDFFGIIGMLVFGSTIAFWAATDSSKFKSRGSEKTGLPFKPVVVFAVCMILGGAGFIWYLFMRHRIQNGSERKPSEPVTIKS